MTSLAFRDIGEPDFSHVTVIVRPPGTTADPRVWARAIFDVRRGSPWVVALLALRQVLVGLVGIRRAPRDVFAVAEVDGAEALVAADDTHLDFRVGIRIGARDVRATTTVYLHGWRGRLYLMPVRLLHGVVLRSMMRRAARRLHGAAGASTCPWCDD